MPKPSPAPAKANMQSHTHAECSSGVQYDLLALDIDGTLLRSDKRLPKANVEAVRRAVAAGVHVVLATARPPRSMQKIYQKLGLSTVVIHYNGALIADPVLNRTVFHQPLKPETAQAIVRAARRLDPNVLVHLEVEDRWITDRHDPRFETATSKHFSPDVYGPLKPHLKQPVTKLMLMGMPDDLKPIQQTLAKRFANDIDVHVTDSFLLQIVTRGVDKGRALDRVARMYNVAEHRVMAIGDAPNDVGMLSRAGLGLAMGNGWDEAKQAANAVIGSNDDDAVAQAIQDHLFARPHPRTPRK